MAEESHRRWKEHAASQSSSAQAFTCPKCSTVCTSKIGLMATNRYARADPQPPSAFQNTCPQEISLPQPFKILVHKKSAFVITSSKVVDCVKQWRDAVTCFTLLGEGVMRADGTCFTLSVQTDCPWTFFLTTVFSHKDFSHGKFGLLSLRRVSCDKARYPTDRACWVF